MVAVRTGAAESAFKAASACIEGGIRFVEITFSVPGAEEVIRELSSDTRVIIGAGTILSLSNAKKALKAGAKYIVRPHFDAKIVKFTKKEGLISIPGACTPTEIYKAYEAGGDIIKLFPFVEMGGLGFLKVIRGPLPFIKYMLSGGVNLNNLNQYLEAEPSCILIGSAILKKEYIQTENWSAIKELAGSFVKKINRPLSL
jgi:2-dehydro-3-deoxyphosphogluconate aldolase/(4S)-4-hydroxy-2-oxoglutarate aldolase